MSRCVRRAYLCGNDPLTGQDFEYRREWVEDRLFALVEIFAVDLHAYAVMSNHLHLVVRVNRDRAERWSDQEITRRYGKLFRFAVKDIANLGADEKKARIETWRERLWSLSWLMRCLNESIARRANAEDECKGRFWEGRFRCQPLLDEGALLACMAYVDLNPVRAGMSKSLEKSTHTSIAKRLEEGTPHGLTPFADQVSPRSRRTVVPVHFDDYLELLVSTGRAIRRGGSLKRVPALLLKMRLNHNAFLSIMRGGTLSGVLGSVAQVDAFAGDYGKHWVKGRAQAKRLFDR
ncbi:MAG: hypothetical protein AAGE52_31115 [Myxococcota bacterium]